MEQLDGGGSNPLIDVDLATDEGGNALVRLRGELDLSSIPAVEKSVGQLLDGKPACLIVDVSEVRFADSSAIALWVRWSAVVDDFELRGPSPMLARVITAMGLADRFGIAQ